MSNFKFSQRSLDRLTGVDQRLQEVLFLALTITKVDFGIPQYGGLRTAEEQKKLYDDRKSQLDGINRRSNHQTGRAVDIFPYVDGKASYEKEHLFEVATAILAAASQLGVPLNWGGHWRKFVDMPHFELSRIGG